MRKAAPREPWSALALAIACMPFLPLSASAQCEHPTDARCVPEEITDPEVTSTLTRGTIAMRVYLGLSPSSAPPVIPGLDDGLRFGFGVTAASKPSWPVTLDLTWTAWSRSFPTEDAPSLGPLLTVNDRVDLLTNAVTAGLRVSLPPTAPVRVYAAAGLGWVHHKAKLDGSLFFIPGTVAESASTDWTTYWGGGVDTRFDAWGASLDFRRMDTSASFGEPFDIPKVDLGGSIFSVGVSWWPGS